jgi:hypothetical protein
MPQAACHDDFMLVAVGRDCHVPEEGLQEEEWAEMSQCDCFGRKEKSEETLELERCCTAQRINRHPVCTLVHVSRKPLSNYSNSIYNLV